MPVQPQTKTGTLRLSEIARHVVVPDGITSTGWPAVRDKCTELGVTFDDWQDGTGRLILAKRADGAYAASIGGVVLSIPRQVGKTFLIGAIVFALCLLHPGLTVLWTAHRLRTANETFSKMQSFARRRKVTPHVSKIVLGSGDEEIQFLNGSRIMFGARERGFGRGFDDVDVEVFDEAQILTENAVDDMIPAMNTAANPLPIFIGTPPKPADPSEVFTAKRAAALDGSEVDGVYIELSADRGCDPQDRKQWRKANPSHPKRTPESAMLRMCRNLTPESFIREGLGVWDESSGSLFDLDAWADLAISAEVVELEGRPSPVALAVATSQDRQWTHIGLVGMRADGVTRHLVVARSMRGTEGAKAAVEDLIEKWSPVGLAVNPASPAGSLIPELRTIPKVRSKRCQLWEVSPRQEAQAVGMFLDGFAGRTDEGDGEPSLSHQGQQVLGIAVEHAELRNAGQSQTFDHRVEGADVAPLQAVTLALFALMTLKSKRATVRASFQ